MPKPLTEEELQKIREWASRLPKEPRSDWEGTNHYEITGGEDEYWWLFLGDCLNEAAFGPVTDTTPVISETEAGKRIGLIMDLACAVPRLLATLDAAEAEKKKAVTEAVHKTVDRFYRRPTII